MYRVQNIAAPICSPYYAWFGSAHLTSNIPIAAFTTPPSDVVVARGDSVRFDCVFTSSAPVSINWQNGGRVLLPSSKYTYLSNNSLVIMTTEAGDDGEYTCVVTNQLTQQTSSQSATMTFACEYKTRIIALASLVIMYTVPVMWICLYPL